MPEFTPSEPTDETIYPDSVHGLLASYDNLGVHENHIDTPGKVTWKAIVTGVDHTEADSPYLFNIAGQYANTHTDVVHDAGLENERFFPVDGTRALMRLQAHERTIQGQVTRELEADIVLNPLNGTPEKALELGIALLQAGNSLGSVLNGPYDAMYVGYPAAETHVWQIHTDELGVTYATPAATSLLDSPSPTL